MAEQTTPQVVDVPNAARRSFRWEYFALLPLVLMLFGVGAGTMETGSRVLGGLLLTSGALGYLSWIVAAIVKGRSLFFKETPGALRATDGEVRFNGAVIATRGQFDNGGARREPASDRCVVELGKKGRPPAHVVIVPKQTDGLALLEQLGLDAAHTTLSRSFPSAWGYNSKIVWAGLASLFGGFMFAPLVAAALGGPAAIVPIVLGYLTMMSVAIAPTRVTVGADGVLVQWTFARRFIRYEDVARVEQTENGLALVRNDGTRFDLNLSGGTRGNGVHRQEYIAQERAMIVDRIAQVMAARAAAPQAQIDPSALARGDAPAAAWLERLRGLLGAEAGFRQGAVLPEQLWAVIEDRASSDEARAAAAAVLGPTLDDAGRSRLRAVLDTVASPKVRVVLEKVQSRASDDELADALDEAAPSAQVSGRR
jgi:hypothetical protein